MFLRKVKMCLRNNEENKAQIFKNRKQKSKSLFNYCYVFNFVFNKSKVQGEDKKLIQFHISDLLTHLNFKIYRT